MGRVTRTRIFEVGSGEDGVGQDDAMLGGAGVKGATADGPLTQTALCP